MKIAVLRELAEGETRVAATPETVSKFRGLGAEVAIEAGAGALARIPDADYAAAGAAVGNAAATIRGADIVLTV
ncbi:MAG: NAD(P)(+) transhydrogenase (Re/Si-specific) subunit alpha, partial [Alphaproteobacteria bacterium]